MGQLLAVLVTPVKQIQETSGESVEVAFVDRGHTGEQLATDAEAQGIRLEVVKLPTAKFAIGAMQSIIWSAGRYAMGSVHDIFQKPRGH